MPVIYFGAQPLHLVTDPAVRRSAPPQAHIVEQPDDQQLEELLQWMQSKPQALGYLVHPSPEAALEQLKSRMVFIEAAGGLVLTPARQVLLIYRKGKWDLPKGKLDAGEALEDCAVREVQEETGLQQVQLQSPLITTYHTYYQDDRLHLKAAHWYYMTTPLAEALTPQTEEDITECRWVALQETPALFHNMHASVIDVLKEGMARLG